jgi:formamidopyrimidine-DNA glycosylase
VITAVRRRGKYLWWALDDGDAVIAHLGMSGQFRVDGSLAGEAPDATGPPVDSVLHPHLRIRFAFDDSGPDVDFLDQRTFGGMSFAPGGADLPQEIAHIGRDPLDPEFSLAAAVAAIRRKHTEIKRALLDQTVVSGIGNIYADEALWQAKVHYARPTAGMTRPVVSSVLTAATEVMTQALAVGGTSFDAMYVNVNGESGYFDRSLNAYGQQDRPCPRCGTPIRRDAFMNRSSFFCPHCQRRPRRPRAPR